jgi:hypothetical protein
MNKFDLGLEVDGRLGNCARERLLLLRFLPAIPTIHHSERSQVVLGRVQLNL